MKGITDRPEQGFPCILCGRPDKRKLRLLTCMIMRHLLRDHLVTVSDGHHKAVKEFVAARFKDFLPERIWCQSLTSR